MSWREKAARREARDGAEERDAAANRGVHTGWAGLLVAMLGMCAYLVGRSTGEPKRAVLLAVAKARWSGD